MLQVSTQQARGLGISLGTGSRPSMVSPMRPPIPSSPPSTPQMQDMLPAITPVVHPPPPPQMQDGSSGSANAAAVQQMMMAGGPGGAGPPRQLPLPYLISSLTQVWTSEEAIPLAHSR